MLSLRRFRRIPAVTCLLALIGAMLVAAVAIRDSHAAAPRRSTAGSLAQRIHDARVRQKAWSKKHADEMASSREYARRGDDAQADAFLVNAQDSKRKAEMYRRQADALRRQAGSGRRTRRGRR